MRGTVRLLLLPVLLVASSCATVQQRRAATAAAVRASDDVPPATFVRSTADSRTSRTITVRDALSRAAAFRAASDLLSQDLTIDVSDQRAGFLMTTWQTGATHEGVPNLRYRTRVIVRFSGDDWKQAVVRVDANWLQQAGGDEWDVGYDAQLLDRIAAALKEKIGKP